jgi:hypothetical protein
MRAVTGQVMAHRPTTRIELLLALLALLFYGTMTCSRAAQPEPGADTSAAAPLQLRPFEASYAWSWKGVTIAVSHLTLARGSDATWTYDSWSEARGIGRLYPYRPRTRSTLRVSAQGVQPLHYEVQGGGGHNADVSFDWQANHASGTYEGTAVDLALKPGVQDDLSVQIALMVALVQGHTPENISVIDKNSIRDYSYSREGEESLDTRLGKIDTVIYASRHTGSPRTTRFWCAPDLGYLPMRVQQKRLDDVEWTMNIESVKRD